MKLFYKSVDDKTKTEEMFRRRYALLNMTSAPLNEGRTVILSEVEESLEAQIIM